MIDPAQNFDDLNRLIRWKRKFEADEQKEKGFECCPNLEVEHAKNLHDHLFVRKLEIFNERLNIKLEKRRKAIANWRRMKVVLAILKLCGNRMER